MKIIKFGSEFCEPCKHYAPTFNKVVEQFKNNNLEVISLDVDDDNAASLVEYYNIHSIPATVIENDEGKIISLKYGAISEDELKKEIEKAREN